MPALRPGAASPAPPAAALAVLAALLLCAAPGAPLGPREARAGTEEFSTFDVAAQEEDDESLLDHYMTRMPRAWRDEWERAPQAMRTAQGCLTSGQWFVDTDLKLRSPVGSRARLGVELRQSETDAAAYDYLDFSLRVATRFGAPGVMFRPFYDKSRQDFGLTWDAGDDTSTWQAQAAFTFEDLFNNFWAFRQSRVGEESEPYERHPFEPGLRLVARHDRWRAELAGRYLTPSRKRLVGRDDAPAHIATLWGTLAHAALEVRALGLEWEARGANQQAASTDRPEDFSAGDDRRFRRKWSAEVAIRRALSPRLEAEARWLYQDRDQSHGPPDPGSFSGIDRLLAVEATYRVTPELTARAGGLHDRITIARARLAPESHGTRTESRAYVGLTARFGRVLVSAVEGFELDPEPYEVWLVHDKGFLHLQATF